MSTFFMILSIVLLLIAVGGILLINKWTAWPGKQAHEAFGSAIGAKTLYLGPSEYLMEGTYRGYPLQVMPFRSGKTDEGDWMKFHVPMVNPNRKYFRISKGNDGWMKELDPQQVVAVPHQMSKKLDLASSDILFSSVLLTEELKEQIEKVFKQIGRGTVFIKETELAAVLPANLMSGDSWKPYVEVLDLMAAIKDELRR